MSTDQSIHRKVYTASLASQSPRPDIATSYWNDKTADLVQVDYPNMIIRELIFRGDDIEAAKDYDRWLLSPLSCSSRLEAY
jgi:hypothetical protein